VAMVAIDLLDMAVLRLTLAPSQHHSPVGKELGRTIPLADSGCRLPTSRFSAAKIPVVTAWAARDMTGSLFIQCDRHSDNSCEDDKELICVPDSARFECCDWRSFRGTKAWQRANYTNFDPRSQ
jgi:hypothetical protein